VPGKNSQDHSVPHPTRRAAAAIHTAGIMLDRTAAVAKVGTWDPRKLPALLHLPPMARPQIRRPRGFRNWRSFR
jgi:hypothetical protein